MNAAGRSAGTALVLIMALGACTPARAPVASSSPTPSSFVPESSCAPTGAIHFNIVAAGIKFDRIPCLAVQAGTPFNIRFDNRDTVNHNIAILPKPYGYNSPPTPLFFGDIFTGPRVVTYAVPALPAGILTLICYVHHDVMYGTVAVVPRVSVVAGGIKVAWALHDGEPRGFVYDIQVKRPGTSSFVTWLAGQTRASSVFKPDDGAGMYEFRAGIYLAHFALLGWSPPAGVRLD